MALLSMTLQGVGILMALCALALELMASRRRGAEGPNPWESIRVWGVTGNSPRGFPIFHNDSDGKNLKSAVENIHKDMRSLERARRLAAKEWDDQRETTSRERLATARRVQIEMFGLFLATVAAVLINPT